MPVASIANISDGPSELHVSGMYQQHLPITGKDIAVM
jgi:hypothetical protein